MNLEGIGIFIWKISACEKGSWEAIVQKAVESGVYWVAVKSGDAYRNNQWSSKIAPDMIKLAHDAGLKVLTWNYSKPTTWAPEIHHISSLYEEGVDGHIINAEDEWEGYQKDAEIFLASLRKKIGTDKFLAYSTFAFYNFHGTFPYGQFGRYCDAVMPQLYWTEQNQPYAQSAELMDKAFKDMAKAHTDAVKPVYPVGSAYGKGYRDTKGLFSTEDMRAFLKRYRGSYPSLYAWDGASEKVFQTLGEMADLGELDQDVVTEIVTADIPATPTVPATPQAKGSAPLSKPIPKAPAAPTALVSVPPIVAAQKMVTERKSKPSVPPVVKAPTPPQPIPRTDIEVADDDPIVTETDPG